MPAPSASTLESQESGMINWTEGAIFQWINVGDWIHAILTNYHIQCITVHALKTIHPQTLLRTQVLPVSCSAAAIHLLAPPQPSITLQPHETFCTSQWVLYNRFSCSLLRWSSGFDAMYEYLYIFMWNGIDIRIQTVILQHFWCGGRSSRYLRRFVEVSSLQYFSTVPGAD